MDKNTIAANTAAGGGFNARVLGWASTGLLVFITAFIWAPSRDGLEGIYALAFFLPMLGALVLRKPDVPAYGGWLSVIALTYAGFCVISSLWGEPDDFTFFILQWCVLAVWLCGVSWLHTCKPINFDRLYQLLVVIGALTAITVVTEFYWEHPFSDRLEAWTVARNPIVTAQVFGVVALLALALSWQAATPKLAAPFFVCALCALLPVAFSQSRGPLLAFMAITVFSFICIRPVRAIWVTQLIVTLLIGILLALTLDISAILSARGISMSLRDVVWLEVIAQSRAHLWIGLGLAKDTFIHIADIQPFHHAHNAWLDTFYRTGVIGLGLALLHLGLLLRTFDTRPHLLPLYLWLLFGASCLLTDSRLLFWQVDAKWFLYWIPAGLIAAARVHQLTAPAVAAKKSAS